MENRNSWSLINASMCLTTRDHTLEFHQNLPSTPSLINYIYKKRETFYLVKLYNTKSPEKSIEKELKILTQINEKQKISLQILEKVELNNKHFLIYTLKDFLPLSSYLKQKVPIDPQSLIIPLITLLKQVHEKQLIHSCLNLETIFINKDLKLKIIGFENSLNLEDLNLEASKLKKRISIQNKHFKAPELIKHGYNISPAVDIWSLGCILFKILHPSETLDKFDDEKQALVENEQNPIFRRVFKLCFIIDPMLRGSLDAIKQVFTSVPQQFSKITEFLNKSTDSLISSILNSRDVPNPRYFQKLLEKTADPASFSKFFGCLVKKKIDSQEKALKAVWLIHSYSLKVNTLAYREKFLEIKQKIEKFYRKFVGQDNFLESYLGILRDKYELIGSFNVDIGTCWKLDCFNEYSEMILKYLGHLIRFLSKVLSQKEVLNFFGNITESVVNEILIIYSYLMKNIINLGEFKNNLISARIIFSRKLQTIYNRFPFIDFQVSVPLTLEICIHRDSIHAGKLEEMKIDPTQIIISEDELGSGSTSKVLKGILNNEEVAVKVFINNFVDKKYLEREILSNSRLQHPNIVKFLGYFYDEYDQLNLIYEYCKEGSLDKFLFYNKISSRSKLKIALDIAKAMLFMHSQSPPMLHRDLKSENILISKQVLNINEEPIVKITDFGLSRIEGINRMTNRVGTFGWMAPEVKSGKFYTTACDVFSYSIVLWEIFAEPLERQIYIEKLNKQIIDRLNVDLIQGEYSNDLKDLVARCCEENPGNRLDFYDIVSRLESLLNNS